MTEVNPPIALQNAGNTHTAETLRNALGMILSGPGTALSLIPRGGVHITYGNAFSTTQNGTPNMSVNVLSGAAVIPGSEGSKQGGYFVINDGTVNKTIAASNPSLPRIDVVALVVQDSFYSGATNTWAITIITGTAAGSPVAPALPNDALKLFQVAVGAGVTSITNANITDFRPWLTASGGIMRASSSTERDAIPPYGGLAVWRTDLPALQIHNGSSFDTYSPAISTYVSETRNTSTTHVTTGTEVICATLTFTSAGTTARYKVTWNGTIQGSVNGDIGRLRIRHQSGGSLTTGGTQDSIRTYVTTANEGKQFTIVATVSGLSAGTWTIGGTAQRAAGTGTDTVNASATDDEYVLLERIA